MERAETMTGRGLSFWHVFMLVILYFALFLSGMVAVVGRLVAGETDRHFADISTWTELKQAWCRSVHSQRRLTMPVPPAAHLLSLPLYSNMFSVLGVNISSDFSRQVFLRLLQAHARTALLCRLDSVGGS